MVKRFSNSSLLQNLVTFVRNYSMYQPITGLTEGCLGQSVWVQNSKDCFSAVPVPMCLHEKGLRVFPPVWHDSPLLVSPPPKLLLHFYSSLLVPIYMAM